MSDLHRGDLEGAKENLVALAAITRVYADDPTLVNYMIHIAVLGLSIEAAWDALQADGWTDAQLADLQQAFQCDQLLAQMPRTIAAERASRLYELQWFSSHSYLAWVDASNPFMKRSGTQSRTRTLLMPSSHGIFESGCFIQSGSLRGQMRKNWNTWSRCKRNWTFCGRQSKPGQAMN